MEQPKLEVKKFEKVYRACLKLDIVCVSIILIIVWGLLTIPLIIFYIEPLVSYKLFCVI